MRLVSTVGVIKDSILDDVGLLSFLLSLTYTQEEEGRQATLAVCVPVSHSDRFLCGGRGRCLVHLPLGHAAQVTFSLSRVSSSVHQGKHFPLTRVST